MTTEQSSSHTVMVKDLEGKTITVEVAENESTEDLKRKISQKTGVPVEGMGLLQDGKRLDKSLLNDPALMENNPKHILEATQMMIDGRRGDNVDWDLLRSANSNLDGQRWVESLEYTWQTYRKSCNKCAYCGQSDATMRCTACASKQATWSNTTYCSTKCQQPDWATHKSHCIQKKAWTRANLDNGPPPIPLVHHFAELLFLSLHICKASVSRSLQDESPPPPLPPCTTFLVSGTSLFPGVKSVQGAAVFGHCHMYEGTRALIHLRHPIQEAMERNGAAAVGLSCEIEIEPEGEGVQAPEIRGVGEQNSFVMLQVASELTGVITWAAEVIKDRNTGSYIGLGCHEVIDADVADQLLGESPLADLYNSESLDALDG